MGSSNALDALGSHPQARRMKTFLVIALSLTCLSLRGFAGDEIRTNEQRIAELEARVKKIEQELARLTKSAAANTAAPRVAAPMTPEQRDQREQDRKRFDDLPENAKTKYMDFLRANRGEMFNMSPDERREFAKKTFEKIEAEDKASKPKTP